MRLRAAAAMLVAWCVPAALFAQVCLGKPSLSGSPMNLSGALSLTDGATQYGGEMVLGSRAFVSGGFAYSDLDDTEQSLKVVGATLASEVPSADASMCIGVSGAYGFGLELLGFDVTTLGLGPVLAVGVDSELSRSVTMIQHGQFGWIWEKVTVDGGPSGEEDETTDFGALALGVSLVFGRVLAIGGSVTFPIGLESAEKAFTVGMTLAPFGS